MSGILSSVSIMGAQARKNTSKRGARSGGNAALRGPWKTAVETSEVGLSCRTGVEL